MNLLINDKYEINELIGEGTFGKVFSGINKRTNEIVAIKVQFKNVANLLKREATIFNYFKDINGIPKLIDYGNINGFYYLIMNFIGESLDSKQINYIESIKYLIQTLKILSEIHKKKLLHRDIKPENLLINNKGELFIIDFGLANSINIVNNKNDKNDKNDKNHKIIGTLNYCSLNIHYNNEYSYYDDLECLLYTFYKIIYKKLPWQNYNKKHLQDYTFENLERIDFVRLSKEKFVNNLLDLDNAELYLLFKYLKNNNKEYKLPNYQYLINIFNNLLLLL